MPDSGFTSKRKSNTSTTRPSDKNEKATVELMNEAIKKMNIELHQLKNDKNLSREPSNSNFASHIYKTSNFISPSVNQVKNSFAN